MTLDSGSGEEPGKLFVGGLSWETTVEKLSEYFCRYGEVTDCVVMKNPETGRSRGFGFVTYKDPSCVLLVLSSGPHQLDGRTIDPKSCNAKGAQKGKREAKMSNYPKIFLGGLPPDVNETVLRDYFAKYGKVIEVVIMYDQERKKTRGNGFRGFGFLSFESDDAVNNVVSEHYVTINGKKVEVKRAEPRDKPASPLKTLPAPNSQQQLSAPQLTPPQPSIGQQPPVWWPPAGAPHAAAPVMPGPGYPPAWVAPGQPPYGPAAWTPPAPGYQGYWPGYPGFPQAYPSQGYPYGTAFPTNYPGYGQPGVTPPAPMAAGPAPPPVPGATPANGYGSQNPAVGPPLSVPGAPNAQPGAASGGYAQDASSYGPARVFGGYGAPAPACYPYPGGEPGPNGVGGPYNGSPMAGAAMAAGFGHPRGVSAQQVQGFHPYRRV